jgi:4-amino-4-deoxy-L-arabinose transferase-like glycosyltransferase
MVNRFIHHKIYWILLLLVSLVYSIGIAVDVMEVDAAQYAQMSMEMLQNKSFLQVYNRKIDYLDKPPLLFWLSSISMGIFGINNLGFKLPSILASFLAILSIYKIAKIYYSEKAALFSAIMLASSQTFFIINNDIRTDNLLIGFATFSIWQIIKFINRPSYPVGFWVGLGIAMAMLAKGPLGLVFPMLSIVPQIIYSKQWHIFKIYKIWIIPVIIALLLTPMCLGLYQQFGTKGLYFYFWEQSFGRITGQNVWKNNVDPFFLVHTFLYAILPWTILFIVAFWKKIIILFTNKFKYTSSHPEVMGIFGYLLATLALSQSKYQLPHYIYIASPMASLMMAGYVENLSKKNLITWGKIQLIFNISLALFVLFSLFYVWKISIISTILIVFLLAIFIYIFIKVYRYSFIWGGVVTSIFVNILLLKWFYPNLLQYQSPSKVGQKIKELQIQDKSFGYHEFGFTTDFYSKSYIPQLSTNNQIDSALLEHSNIYLYTNPNWLKDLEKYKTETIEEFNFYRVTLLTIDFLNPKTRKNVVQKTMLLKIEAK